MIKNQSQPEYYPVDIKYLSHKVGKDGFSDEDFHTIEKKVEAEAIAPNDFIGGGIGLAKKTINNMEKSLDMEETDPNLMKVFILPNETFGELQKKLFKEVDPDLDGFSINGFEGVILGHDSVPVYEQSAAVFHEFIHKFFERHILAYAKVTDDDNETIDLIEDRRNGMMIKNLRRSTDEVSVSSGLLLNELGNYFMQYRFANILLNSETFQKEAQHRLDNLKRLGVDGSTSNYYLYHLATQIDGEKTDVFFSWG